MSDTSVEDKLEREIELEDKLDEGPDLLDVSGRETAPSYLAPVPLTRHNLALLASSLSPCPSHSAPPGGSTSRQRVSSPNYSNTARHHDRTVGETGFQLESRGLNASPTADGGLEAPGQRNRVVVGFLAKLIAQKRNNITWDGLVQVSTDPLLCVASRHQPVSFQILTNFGFSHVQSADGRSSHLESCRPTLILVSHPLGTTTQFHPPPAHKEDDSITFVKRRPASKITEAKLREFMRRLRKQYPWLGEDVGNRWSTAATRGFSKGDGEGLQALEPEQRFGYARDVCSQL